MTNGTRKGASKDARHIGIGRVTQHIDTVRSSPQSTKKYNQPQRGEEEGKGRRETTTGGKPDTPPIMPLEAGQMHSRKWNCPHFSPARGREETPAQTGSRESPACQNTCGVGTPQNARNPDTGNVPGIIIQPKVLET